MSHILQFVNPVHRAIIEETEEETEHDNKDKAHRVAYHAGSHQQRIENPMGKYRDKEYAAKTRYGTIIAPPAFIFSVLGGVIFLGERMKWPAYAGCAVMLAAVLLSQLSGAGKADGPAARG